MDMLGNYTLCEQIRVLDRMADLQAYLCEIVDFKVITDEKLLHRDI